MITRSPEDYFDEHGVTEDCGPKTKGQASNDLSRKYGRLKVHTLGDEEVRLERQYLLKGLIYKGDCIFLLGPPSSGKTTLAQYIGLAIAQGRAIFGRRVHSGRVLYLAFEGRDLFLVKMQAFEREFGSSTNVVYIAQSMTLLANGPDGADARCLLQAVRGEGADLVICDTWSKMMAGADDNLHRDASAMIQVLDRIRETTGAAVLVIAHPNRTNDDDVSGSATVRKDCDALIRVRGTQGVRTVDSLKLRFGAPGPEFSFDLERVALGVDADGDEITSVILREVQSGPGSLPGSKSKKKDLGPVYRMRLDELMSMLADDSIARAGIVPEEGMPSVRAISRDLITERFAAKGWLSVEQVRRGEKLPNKDVKKVSDTLEALEAAKKICVYRDWVWIP